jgi:hypothetical protein
LRKKMKKFLEEFFWNKNCFFLGLAVLVYFGFST